MKLPMSDPDGKRDKGPDGSYVTTKFFVFAAVPIIPLSSWRVLEVGKEKRRLFGRTQEYQVRRVPLSWRQVLNVSGVGIHDNFFELGGNSLLAVQVVSRVNQANNVGLTLPMIFQHPTVAGITAAVIDLKLKAADPEEMALLLAEFEEMSDAEAAAELTESEGTTPRQNLR